MCVTTLGLPKCLRSVVRQLHVHHSTYSATSPAPVRAEMVDDSRSSHFRNFVREALSDKNWSLTAAAPAGFGLDRLKYLHGFLCTAVAMPPSRRANFGPTKVHLNELRRRLLGVHDFAGSKSDLFESLLQDITGLVAHSEIPRILHAARSAASSDDLTFWQKLEGVLSAP